MAGRNIHALDPYRMPSQAALERGSAVARDILDGHRDTNGGAWPETVAVCRCYCSFATPFLGWFCYPDWARWGGVDG